MRCQIKEASALSRFLDNTAGVCRLGKTSAPLKRPRKIAGDLPRKRRVEMLRTCIARYIQFRPPPCAERLMADVGKHGREKGARHRRGNDIFLCLRYLTKCKL